MLTERTVAALPRARTRAPQVTRLLGLAMLLFGLLFAHGLHGESAAGHLDAGVNASLSMDGPQSSADHEHGQHEDGALTDSAHNCAPGQPDDTLDVPPPDVSPLEVTAPCCLLPGSGMHATKAGTETPPLGAPSVLRI
ncbi:hypothetical protein GCM10010306_088340 [Streptomyces umbrinus]|nr:hypothetical protein GCM10010306_088340 [Streptomyces umbrinus]